MFLGGDLRRRFAHRLPVSSEVRYDAKQSLDHHQLCSVMHFMFFGPEQHLKTAFRSAARLAHLFGQ